MRVWVTILLVRLQAFDVIKGSFGPQFSRVVVDANESVGDLGVVYSSRHGGRVKVMALARTT